MSQLDRTAKLELQVPLIAEGRYNEQCREGYGGECKGERVEGREKNEHPAQVSRSIQKAQPLPYDRSVGRILRY